MKRNSLFVKLLCMSIVIVMMFSLAGCKQTQKPAEPDKDKTQEPVSQTSEPISEEPKIVSAKEEMVVGVYAEHDSLFPGHDMTIPAVHNYVNIYDTLVTMDKDGTILPLLAESWERISDTAYRFHIRKGVKFHNGDALKASDIVFSFKQAKETPSTKVTANPFDVDNCYVEDENTVVISTMEPFAPFLANVCLPGLSILQQSFCEEHIAAGDIDLVANGTGPFKVVKWNQGVNLVVERFDDYWGEPAKLRKLNFRFISEASTRLLELQAGGIDLMQDVPVSMMEDVKSDPNLELMVKEGVNTCYLAVNFDKVPDPRVHEAIAHSFDNDDLCKVCFFGSSTPLDECIPDTVPGAYHTGGYSYDPELSKRLLAEAGYADGYDLEITHYASSDYRRMGEYLQHEMAKAGINVTLNELGDAAWLAALDQGLIQSAFQTKLCTLRDPHQTLGIFYSHLCGPGGNRVNYRDPELDKMLDEAVREFDQEKRMQLYAEIQQYMHDHFVIIPIHNANEMLGITNKMRGFEMVQSSAAQRYSDVYFVN